MQCCQTFLIVAVVFCRYIDLASLYELHHYSRAALLISVGKTRALYNTPIHLNTKYISFALLHFNC